MFWVGTIVTVCLLGGWALLRWGMRWGSTTGERRRQMPGDEFFEDRAVARVAMTRAITIDAPPDRVWPWIAQLGRGAGWYSVDWLDNGRRASAWHIVSWIPEPQSGDATAIGYLRHLDKDKSLAWWVEGVSFAGARARLVSSYLLEPEGQGTRLVSRMSADATGLMARFALLLFKTVDSIMATRQLIGIHDRVECYENDPEIRQDAESGSRDQYQLYEVLYASGSSAGVAGQDSGAQWREAARTDGFLDEAE